MSHDHTHNLLGKSMYVDLQDVHTEPGVFVDSERGQATMLLFGSCRLCGIVYMPLVACQDDSTPSAPTTAQLSLFSSTTNHMTAHVACQGVTNHDEHHPYSTPLRARLCGG